jgi:hypothetical protein
MGNRFRGSAEELFHTGDIGRILSEFSGLRDRGVSVVIRTAQVIAALSADQLTVMAGKHVAAVGANLLMMNLLTDSSCATLIFR